MKEIEGSMRKRHRGAKLEDAFKIKRAHSHPAVALAQLSEHVKAANAASDILMELEGDRHVWALYCESLQRKSLPSRLKEIAVSQLMSTQRTVERVRRLADETDDCYVSEDKVTRKRARTSRRSGDFPAEFQLQSAGSDLPSDDYTEEDYFPEYICAQADSPPSGPSDMMRQAAFSMGTLCKSEPDERLWGPLGNDFLRGTACSQSTCSETNAANTPPKLRSPRSLPGTTAATEGAESSPISHTASPEQREITDSRAGATKITAAAYACHDVSHKNSACCSSVSCSTARDLCLERHHHHHHHHQLRFSLSKGFWRAQRCVTSLMSTVLRD